MPSFVEAVEHFGFRARETIRDAEALDGTERALDQPAGEPAAPIALVRASGRLGGVLADARELEGARARAELVAAVVKERHRMFGAGGVQLVTRRVAVLA
jgi:hypothetical protein